MKGYNMTQSIATLALALMLGLASVDSTDNSNVYTNERCAEPTGTGTILPPP